MRCEVARDGGLFCVVIAWLALEMSVDVFETENLERGVSVRCGAVVGIEKGAC